MAITYVGKGTFRYSTSSLSVSPPASTEQYDLLLLIITSSGNITAISGWTAISDQIKFTGSYNTRTFYKFAGASEGNATVPDYGAQFAIMCGFRGVNTDNPINAYTTNTDSNTSYSAANPTSTASGCMLVNCLGVSGSTGTTNIGSWANTSLVSITEGHDESVSNAGVAFAYGIKTSAGAINDTTATVNGTLDSNGSTNVLLAPTQSANTGKFFAFF